MHMNQPALIGSDPETSAAIPEQLIRIEIAVGEDRIRVDGAVNRVLFKLIAGNLFESSTSDANDEATVVGQHQVGQPHSRYCISLWRAGPPPPKSRVCADPDSAGFVLSQ